MFAQKHVQGWSRKHTSILLSTALQCVGDVFNGQVWQWVAKQCFVSYGNWTQHLKRWEQRRSPYMDELSIEVSLDQNRICIHTDIRLCAERTYIHTYIHTYIQYHISCLGDTIIIYTHMFSSKHLTVSKYFEIFTKYFVSSIITCLTILWRKEQWQNRQTIINMYWSKTFISSYTDLSCACKWQIRHGYMAMDMNLYWLSCCSLYCICSLIIN